jgi:transcriptional regulator GlxA family with amidase domain
LADCEMSKPRASDLRKVSGCSTRGSSFWMRPDPPRHSRLRTAVVHQHRPGPVTVFGLSRAWRPDGPLCRLDRLNASAPRRTVDCRALADQAATSPRNFARAFAVEIGMTPRAIERLRLEMARTAVAISRLFLAGIAEVAGFGDVGRMRRAFLRGLGQPPQALRRVARRAQLD